MKTFSQKLLLWYEKHGRKDLPWQHDITPYRVWVSEIMLQQTQVATVIPYFTRFMDTFGDVHSLARASIDQVLHLWTGLGYYSRARNLHQSAKIISENCGGEFPDSLDEMMKLPGIGRSTAGAILAISKQQHCSILDGNVKRVLARHHAVEGWPGDKKVADKLWKIAEKYTPKKRVDEYTQAIMDLGATLCTRTKPRCDECPLNMSCASFASGRQVDYPHKKPKKINPVKSTVFLMIKSDDGECVLLERRPPIGIWGGLYCFVQCKTGDEINHYCKDKLGLNIVSQEKMAIFRHTFSHFHLDIQPVQVRVSNSISKIMDSDRFIWYKLGQINECGLAAPVKKLIQQLESEVSR